MLDDLYDGVNLSLDSGTQTFSEVQALGFHADEVQLGTDPQLLAKLQGGCQAEAVHAHLAGGRTEPDILPGKMVHGSGGASHLHGIHQADMRRVTQQVNDVEPAGADIQHLNFRGPRERLQLLHHVHAQAIVGSQEVASADHADARAQMKSTSSAWVAQEMQGS